MPANEPERIQDLYRLEILDSAPEIQFDRVTRIAKILFRVRWAVLSLIDNDRQWFKSTCGLNVEGTPRDQAFCAYTILEDRPLAVLDASKDDRFAANPLVCGDLHLRFYAGTPVYGPSGERVGSLCILDPEPRANWSAVDSGLLKDLAAILTSELSARMERKEHQRAMAELSQLQKLAAMDERLDALTGLPDRRSLEALLLQAKSAADASDRFLALVLIDLDKVSRVNDEYGEAAGDQVLKTVALRFRSACRSNDVVIRIAGDQFLVLLQGLEYTEYVNRPVSKLLEAATQPVRLECGKEVLISMSAGMAFYPHGGSNSVDLMIAAKQAMLAAKEAGGNVCVVSIPGKENTFVRANGKPS